jgi:6-phosphogluconate dehydrogenase
MTTHLSSPAASTATATPAADRFIGVVGLAVMGENLARNIARNGFAVGVYNRTPARTQEFIAAHGEAAGIRAAYDVAGFVASLARPRRVLLMVKAGAPVDAVIA